MTRAPARGRRRQVLRRASRRKCDSGTRSGSNWRRESRAEECWQPLGAEKGQEAGFPPEASGKNMALLMPCFRLLTCRTIGKQICVVEATKCVVIASSSNETLRGGHLARGGEGAAAVSGSMDVKEMDYTGLLPPDPLCFCCSTAEGGSLLPLGRFQTLG